MEDYLYEFWKQQRRWRLISHLQNYDNLGSVSISDIRSLIVRSGEVSKPLDWHFELSHRFEIWQAPRQQCFSERLDNSYYKSRGFETLRDLTIRRLIGYWNGPWPLTFQSAPHPLDRSQVAGIYTGNYLVCGASGATNGRSGNSHGSCTTYRITVTSHECHNVSKHL